MSASQILYARLVKAAIAFIVLHAIVFAIPAMMSGDADAIRSTLVFGSGLFFAVLAALLVVVVPLGIILSGSEAATEEGRKIRWPIAGAVSAAAFGFFFLFGPDAVALSSMAGVGAIAGFALALLHREPRRWAAN